MLRQFTGRVAVVTGAAHGLGRAIARELAIRKCRLALIDRDSSALAAAAEELRAHSESVTAHVADVSAFSEVERVAAEVRDAHGSAHLLVNNAAVSASASFLQTGPADFDRIMAVNFFGVVHGCRAFLPLLLLHGEGQILNVSSCFAWVGYPRKTAYAASKGALRAFSEALRSELAGSGVGVTVLFPGPLRTSLVRTGICESAESRRREERFLLSRGLDPAHAARVSLNRLLSNPGRIVVGLDYRLLDLLARLSPRLAVRAMRIAAARAGF